MTLVVDGSAGLTFPDTKAQTTAYKPEGYIYIRDQKASGTAAQNGSGTTWNKRNLNTIVADTVGIAALSSDQFVLPAGTYRLSAHAPTYRQNQHQLRLRNVTDGVTVANGGSFYSDSGTVTGSDATLRGRFTIATSKTFELQHWIATVAGGAAMGNQVTSGEIEIYAEIEFWKENT